MRNYRNLARQYKIVLKDFLTVNNNVFVNNYLLDGDCAYEGDGVMINSGKFDGKLRSELKNKTSKLF